MNQGQMDMLREFCENFESDHGGSTVWKEAAIRPVELALYVAAKAYLDQYG